MSCLLAKCDAPEFFDSCANLSWYDRLVSVRRWVCTLAVAATCSALNATAATITSTWLGGAGAWEDPTQWSAGVPQNTASDSYTAAIDGQNPVASQVTLSTTATALLVNPGATCDIGAVSCPP